MNLHETMLWERNTFLWWTNVREKIKNQLVILNLRTVSSHFRSNTPCVDNKEKVYDLAWSFQFSFRLRVYIIFCSIAEYSQKKQCYSDCFVSSYFARKLVARAEFFIEMIWWAYFMSSRGMNLFLTCSARMSLVFARSTHFRGELWFNISVVECSQSLVLEWILSWIEHLSYLRWRLCSLLYDCWNQGR